MSSRAVQLGALSALSLALTGCASDEVHANCVERGVQNPDGSYRVVDDAYCDRYHGYYGGHSYYWHYGGRRVGSRILGGSSVRPRGVTIRSNHGVIQRGGFGSRFRGGS